jgi:hypothetical protein
MKKNKWIALLFFSTACLLIYTSCHKEGENVTKVSAHGSSSSHYNGSDCMTCHKKSGNGAGGGWFVVAGSVYKPDMISNNPNATIHLYSAQNGGGTEVAKIEADAYGNFFTTNSIDFGNGLYPAVESSTGTIHYMNSFTVTGDCNGCHNSSTSQAGRVFGD